MVFFSGMENSLNHRVMLFPIGNLQQKGASLRASIFCCLDMPKHTNLPQWTYI